MNPQQTWQSVLGQLQQEMPRASFETWVRDTEVLSLEKNLLTVSTRNAYARDWLEARVTNPIQRILQEDQPYVWLFVQNLMYAASEDVQNFEPYANVPMWNVHNWVISAQ